MQATTNNRGYPRASRDTQLFHPIYQDQPPENQTAHSSSTPYSAQLYKYFILVVLFINLYSRALFYTHELRYIRIFS